MKNGSPLFSFDMVFPHLSSTPREIRECIQVSGSLPDPWAVLPLRGSHRAARDVPVRKSHHTVTYQGFMPEAVRHLQAGYRSDHLDRHGVHR